MRKERTERPHPKMAPANSALAVAQYSVVLLDDDQSYQALFATVGKSLGISVQVFSSLSEMVSFAYLRTYDFAVIDYHLECLKGTEIAEYADVFFPNLPVFLISADENAETEAKSFKSIKRFYNKSDSPFKILKDAVEMIDSSEEFNQR